MPTLRVPAVTIRKIVPEDRTAIRRISCETSFLGIPHRHIFDDEELLADLLTVYYTDYEPQSCFAATDRGNVVGYLCGTRDTDRMIRLHAFRILPRCVIAAIARGTFIRPKNIRFIGRIMASFLKGEFAHPSLEAYPATFHVNIDIRYRGHGIGGNLVFEFERYLKKSSIPGVWCGTMSRKAADFFISLGFSVLYRTRRTYLASGAFKDIPYVLLAKSIS